MIYLQDLNLLKCIAFAANFLLCQNCSPSNKESKEHGDISVQAPAPITTDTNPEPLVTDTTPKPTVTDPKPEAPMDPKKDEVKQNHHLRNLLVSEKFIPSKVPDLYPVKTPDDLEQVCRMSSGVWHKNLYTCTCDDNMLFSPHLGCTALTVSPKGMQCLEKGMRKILEKDPKEFTECLENMFPKRYYLSFSDWNGAEFKRELLAEKLDLEAFSFLRGENLNTKYDPKDLGFGTKIKITSDNVSLKKYGSNNYSSRLYYPPERELIVSLPFNPTTMDFKKFNASSCFDKISPYLHATEQESIKNICASLNESIADIREEIALEYSDLYDVKSCDFCSKNHASFGEEYKSYSVSFKHFFSLERVLFLSTKDINAVVLLSALGNIESLELSWDASSKAHAQGFLRGSKTVLLDWNTGALKITYDENSSLNELWDYLNKKKGKPSFNFEADDYFGLHLVDNGLDLLGAGSDYTYLDYDRLAKLPSHYSSESFLQFLKGAPLFEKPFFNWKFESQISLLKFIKIGTTPNSHGNGMADLMSKDLKNVSLTISSNLFNPEWMSRESSNQILKLHKIKVVSTVVNYLHMESSLVKALLEDNPDTIFVFCAGNYDSVDYKMDPTWSAGMSELPNVIVAAMYDPASEGKVKGSRGWIPTVAVETPSLGGTSLSSAMIGNLAAKLRKKYPEMNAGEIVSLIQNHIRKVNGLAVRSSGVVDLNIDHY